MADVKTSEVPKKVEVLKDRNGTGKGINPTLKEIEVVEALANKLTGVGNHTIPRMSTYCLEANIVAN